MDISKSIREQIKEGVSIYELYEKYKVDYPFLLPQELVEKDEGKKFTDEEWEKWQEDAMVGYLEMQVDFETNGEYSKKYPQDFPENNND